MFRILELRSLWPRAAPGSARASEKARAVPTPPRKPQEAPWWHRKEGLKNPIFKIRYLATFGPFWAHSRPSRGLGWPCLIFLCQFGSVVAQIGAKNLMFIAFFLVFSYSFWEQSPSRGSWGHQWPLMATSGLWWPPVATNGHQSASPKYPPKCPQSTSKVPPKYPKSTPIVPLKYTQSAP